MHARFFAGIDPFVYPAFVGVFVFIGILIVAVVWLFFPFIVSGKITALTEEAERQTKLLEIIARNTGHPGESMSAPEVGEKSSEGWKKTMRG
jgi:hypothetical protein